MDWTGRRERYRALIEGDGCIHPGSVYDPISARIAEDLGFEVGMLGGSIASMAVLGAPDLIVMTLTEFAGQVYRICRAGELPLMVDADHGYGNALNVMRTVEELEAAGVSGLTIEDTELPPPYGAEGPRLLTLDEGVGKMKAALAARGDPRLAIVGRTSAATIADMDDAMRRIAAYEGAGVDAVFLTGIRTRVQVETIRATVRIPVILGAAGPEIADLDYLASNGVRICLQGHQPFMAAVEAVYASLKALREGTPPAELKGVASRELMRRVTRDEDYERWTKDFLGG
ncbi:MAG: isocitrate lyase/PEP mutase family protein [Defluviicoccus sp.]|nr:isocitrate lyase/PEP mutase family protein [Defluviicoccus sp.]MDE0277519.1 isocitrate lyase/PEP mutase family protein [Defluviicoccus sp.]